MKSAQAICEAGFEFPFAHFPFKKREKFFASLWVRGQSLVGSYRAFSVSVRAWVVSSGAWNFRRVGGTSAISTGERGTFQ